MLDMKWIRQHQDLIQAVADQKGIAISIAQLVELDSRKRELLQEVERLRQERNRMTQNINADLRQERRRMTPEIDASLSQPELDTVEQKKRDVKEINRRLNELEIVHREAEQQFRHLMLVVPNAVSPDTPAGRSDEDNVEIKRKGEPTTFGFNPKDHVTLGGLHHLFDIPRGVKTAGSRNYYLTGPGVSLHRAVQQLALDVLARKGFTLLDVPLMVRTEALVSTGYFPLGQEQAYGIAGEDKWLVGTSEVPLVAFYSDEIVDVSTPIKLAAVSPCFRNEVGSAGKDTQGLYRVHQFSKVEQVIICEDSLETAKQLFREITENAEEILNMLELPYRIVAVCAGDMSQKTYKQWDIETWMPSRQAYGETHSSSNLLDFQARRAGIKFRDADGKSRFCYTLNNTAVASPRILIPLLENHQEEDGVIRIPQALRKYMNGMERLSL